MRGCWTCPWDRQSIQHITFGTPTLPPMAYTMFVCAMRTNVAQGRYFAQRQFEERWADIKQVNQTVNRSIIPESKNRAWPMKPG